MLRDKEKIKERSKISCSIEENEQKQHGPVAQTQTGFQIILYHRYDSCNYVRLYEKKIGCSISRGNNNPLIFTSKGK